MIRFTKIMFVLVLFLSFLCTFIAQMVQASPEESGFVTAIAPSSKLPFYEPAHIYVGMVYYIQYTVFGCRVALYELKSGGWSQTNPTFTIGKGQVHLEVIPTDPRMYCVGSGANEGFLTVSSDTKVLLSDTYAPIARKR